MADNIQQTSGIGKQVEPDFSDQSAVARHAKFIGVEEYPSSLKSRIDVALNKTSSGSVPIHIIPIIDEDSLNMNSPLKLRTRYLIKTNIACHSTDEYGELMSMKKGNYDQLESFRQYLTGEHCSAAQLSRFALDALTAGTNMSEMPSKVISAIDIIKEYSNDCDEERENKLLHFSETKEFTETDATEFSLLKKFADHRDELMRKYDFLNKNELALVLGIPSNSPNEKRHMNRRINTLRTRGEILGAKFNEDYVYPAFQFSERDKDIYPSLKKRLPEMLFGRSGWDVCFWLDTEKNVLLEKAVASTHQVEQALAKGMEAYNELMSLESSQSVWLAAKPLTLLGKGQNSEFEAFVEDWLEPDLREVPTKAVKLDIV